MSSWGDYWERVCAPKLRARKRALGRALPEREIAAYVQSATGKRSERALVSLWILGKREPYISQFYALCEKLEMDPIEVLLDTQPTKGRKHFRGDEIPHKNQDQSNTHRTTKLGVLPRRKNR